MTTTPAVPSGCSRIRREQNFLSPACPAATAPSAGLGDGRRQR